MHQFLLPISLCYDHPIKESKHVCYIATLIPRGVMLTYNHQCFIAIVMAAMLRLFTNSYVALSLYVTLFTV